MSGAVDALVEMGFTKEKIEVAVAKTGSEEIQVVLDWLVNHSEEVEAPQSAPVVEPQTTEQEQPIEIDDSEDPQSSTEEQTVRSIKCDDCGKLFQSQTEVEFHAAKTGHGKFSESTEEKKPLSEEEKKEQLAKIEAKLKQRRLDREAREKLEALEREKNRIKSGKEMLEAKKKYEELEMKKLVELRKREKEEQKMARQRVKDQIEQDKLARKAKFSGQPAEEPQPPPQLQLSQKSSQTYNEVTLQIRLTNGSALVQKFGAKEPLSAVRLYIEMNRKDGDGPFSLMITHPRKVFGPEDYDIPLESLGLGPRATLIVSKT